MRAESVGSGTWMLVSDSGQCQPLKYRGHRACEYKIHHPRACRAYAFQTSRGFVIVRIEDKTESDQQFNATMRSVTATFDQFLEEGERYE